MATTANYTYPGVYLNETAVAAHTITAATTNWTAFLGPFPRGPVDKAVLVTSFGDFANQFGALADPDLPFGTNPPLAVYGIWQFFQGGGIAAWVVRLAQGATAGAPADAVGPLTLSASSPGLWASAAQLSVEVAPSAGAKPLAGASSFAPDHVDLLVTSPGPSTQAPVVKEVITGLVASDLAGLAATINATSYYVQAATPTAALTPAHSAFTSGSATFGNLNLTTRGDWTTDTGLAARTQWSAVQSDPANPTSLDLVLTGSPVVVHEKVANIAAGPAAVVAAVINQQSTLLSATPDAHTLTSPLVPQSQLIVGGTDPGFLKKAVVLAGTDEATAVSADDEAAPDDDASAEAEGVVDDDSPEAEDAVEDDSEAEPGLTAQTSPTDESLLKEAILAELGADPNVVPAPVPRLDRIAPQHFNIMCIPDAALLSSTDQQDVVNAAHRFCSDRQAFLIVDPPPPNAALKTAWLPSPGATAIDNVGTTAGMNALSAWATFMLGPNNVAAATYYPWVQIGDPWSNGGSRFVPPSGTVAGVYASTDSTRGVWKAPAGTAATLEAVTSLADSTITDAVDGVLNVQGINCLRTFPIYGNVTWGSRTLAGSDIAQSPFKYVPVRRLTDFIEQSLQQSLQWAVFEPNGPPLWSSLALEATSFMTGLAASGAFNPLMTPPFTVACDATTTSTADMLAGIVNLNVSFAAVEPAEFVVLNITLNAGAAAAS